LECDGKEISDVAKNPLQRTCMNVKLIWILSEGHLKLLEAFQGEMTKQILKFPKHYSNTCAVTALDRPSVRLKLADNAIDDFSHCANFVSGCNVSKPPPRSAPPIQSHLDSRHYREGIRKLLPAPSHV